MAIISTYKSLMILNKYIPFRLPSKMNSPYRIQTFLLINKEHQPIRTINSFSRECILRKRVPLKARLETCTRIWFLLDKCFLTHALTENKQ